MLTAAEINAAIKAEGLCWVAEENKFSHWTLEEFRSLMGAFPPEEIYFDNEIPMSIAGKGGKPSKPPKGPKPQLPKEFDWRDNNGTSKTKRGD